MLRRAAAVSFALFSMSLACCAQQPPAAPTPPERPITADVRPGNDFAFALLRQLGSGNRFLCPHSLRTAFALAWAATDGDSHAQIGTVLGFGDDAATHRELGALRDRLARLDGSGIELSLADRLWGSARAGDYEAAFLQFARTHYGAALGAVDFGEPETARATINAWVAEQTRGHVAELMPKDSITPLTFLVITDAIWFSGPWQQPFAPEATRPRPFAIGGDAEQRVEVPTMHRSGEIAFGRDAGCSAVALPYADGELRMVLMLPDEGDLAAFTTQLSGAGYARLRAALRPSELQLALPRFAMQHHYALHEEKLPALGMTAPFRFSKDWTPLNADREELCITGVFHGAGIEVDERGTEAQAATGIAIGKRAMPQQLSFDHPFLFTIEETRTGTILFLGAVSDPRGS